MTTNNPAGQADHTRRTREASDRLPAVWSTTTAEGPYNVLLVRPALRSLIPEGLAGAVVLDAGCGSERRPNGCLTGAPMSSASATAGRLGGHLARSPSWTAAAQSAWRLL